MNDDPTAQFDPPDPVGSYDAEYFRSYRTGPTTHVAYERGGPWQQSFDRLAGQIVRTLRPTTVLDVGCAIGLLVEGLVDRGVDAHGVDVSEWAVAQAQAVLGDRVHRRSATEPMEGPYDLVVSIETVEHLPASDARTAISNLARAGNQLLLSTTPADFAEPTHLNVRPPSYWARLLADHGMFADHDYDASFLSPWATLFRRRDPADVSSIVADYERRRWDLTVERDALRDELLAMHAAAPCDDHERTIERLQADVQVLRHDLRRAVDAALAAEASEGNAVGRVRHVEYALHVAKRREAELEEMVEQLDGEAGDVRAAAAALREWEAMRESTLFKVFKTLTEPYRRIRR